MPVEELEDLEESSKRRRVDAGDGDAGPRFFRCEFFIARKGRTCSRQRKADQKYCPDHLSEEEAGKLSEERVACPFDGKHSVWARDLKKHLKKCNARPKEIREVWFRENYNVEDNEGEKGRVELEFARKESLTGEDGENRAVHDYIDQLRGLANEFRPLEYVQLQHQGFNKRLSEVGNQKHAVQQSSLVGHLKRNGILDPQCFYLEFGCGKAELSRYVNTCILQDYDSSTLNQGQSYGFGFIDRGTNRMKMESKIAKDCEEDGRRLQPQLKRIRADIKDLHLDMFLKETRAETAVIISKHLCGSATDLTLKLLLKSSLLHGPGPKFGGLLIAMCCRHACDYHRLPMGAKRYLKDKGFADSKDFDFLKRAASWAVCGSGTSAPPKDTSNEAILSTTEREELGLAARRLIDESRVAALKQALANTPVEVRMFLYVDRETTAENVCLSIVPC